MNRRGFLQALGLGAAGFALDPERLLWVPGRVTTFDLGAVPDALRWTVDGGGNTLLTIDWITRETLRVLEQNLSTVQLLNRTYDARFEERVPLRWR